MSKCASVTTKGVVCNDMPCDFELIYEANAMCEGCPIVNLLSLIQNI